jgi:hypothetical protein
MQKIQFIASIPNIASAVTIGGDQATRLKIDVAQSELPEVLKLISFYSEKPFRVTIEPVDE